MTNYNEDKTDYEKRLYRKTQIDLNVGEDINILNLVPQ